MIGAHVNAVGLATRWGGFILFIKDSVGSCEDEFGDLLEGVCESRVLCKETFRRASVFSGANASTTWRAIARPQLALAGVLGV